MSKYRWHAPIIKLEMFTAKFYVQVIAILLIILQETAQFNPSRLNPVKTSFKSIPLDPNYVVLNHETREEIVRLKNPLKSSQPDMDADSVKNVPEATQPEEKAPESMEGRKYPDSSHGDMGKQSDTEISNRNNLMENLAEYGGQEFADGNPLAFKPDSEKIPGQEILSASQDIRQNDAGGLTLRKSKLSVVTSGASDYLLVNHQTKEEIVNLNDVLSKLPNTELNRPNERLLKDDSNRIGSDSLGSSQTGEEISEMNNSLPKFGKTEQIDQERRLQYKNGNNANDVNDYTKLMVTNISEEIKISNIAEINDLKKPKNNLVSNQIIFNSGEDSGQMKQDLESQLSLKKTNSIKFLRPLERQQMNSFVKDNRKDGKQMSNFMRDSQGDRQHMSSSMKDFQEGRQKSNNLVKDGQDDRQQMSSFMRGSQEDKQQMSSLRQDGQEYKQQMSSSMKDAQEDRQKSSNLEKDGQDDRQQLSSFMRNSQDKQQMSSLTKDGQEYKQQMSSSMKDVEDQKSSSFMRDGQENRQQMSSLTKDGQEDRQLMSSSMKEVLEDKQKSSNLVKDGQDDRQQISSFMRDSQKDKQQMSSLNKDGEEYKQQMSSSMKDVEEDQKSSSFIRDGQENRQQISSLTKDGQEDRQLMSNSMKDVQGDRQKSSNLVKDGQQDNRQQMSSFMRDSQEDRQRMNSLMKDGQEYRQQMSSSMKNIEEDQKSSNFMRDGQESKQHLDRLMKDGEEDRQRMLMQRNQDRTSKQISNGNRQMQDSMNSLTSADAFRFIPEDTNANDEIKGNLAKPLGKYYDNRNRGSNSENYVLKVPFLQNNQTHIKNSDDNSRMPDATSTDNPNEVKNVIKMLKSSQGQEIIIKLLQTVMQSQNNSVIDLTDPENIRFEESKQMKGGNWTTHNNKITAEITTTASVLTRESTREYLGTNGTLANDLHFQNATTTERRNDSSAQTALFIGLVSENVSSPFVIADGASIHISKRLREAGDDEDDNEGVQVNFFSDLSRFSRSETVKSPDNTSNDTSQDLPQKPEDKMSTIFMVVVGLAVLTFVALFITCCSAIIARRRSRGDDNSSVSSYDFTDAVEAVKDAVKAVKGLVSGDKKKGRKKSLRNYKSEVRRESKFLVENALRKATMEAPEVLKASKRAAEDSENPTSGNEEDTIQDISRGIMVSPREYQRIQENRTDIFEPASVRRPTADSRGISTELQRIQEKPNNSFGPASVRRPTADSYARGLSTELNEMRNKFHMKIPPRRSPSQKPVKNKTSKVTNPDDLLISPKWSDEELNARDAAVLRCSPTLMNVKEVALGMSPMARRVQFRSSIPTRLPSYDSVSSHYTSGSTEDSSEKSNGDSLEGESVSTRQQSAPLSPVRDEFVEVDLGVIPSLPTISSESSESNLKHKHGKLCAKNRVKNAINLKSADKSARTVNTVNQKAFSHRSGGLVQSQSRIARNKSLRVNDSKISNHP